MKICLMNPYRAFLPVLLCLGSLIGCDAQIRIGTSVEETNPKTEESTKSKADNSVEGKIITPKEITIFDLVEEREDVISQLETLEVRIKKLITQLKSFENESTKTVKETPELWKAIRDNDFSKVPEWEKHFNK